MTGWFLDALVAAGHSWVLLTGALEERVDLAVRVADQLLARHLTFVEPVAFASQGSQLLRGRCGDAGE